MNETLNIYGDWNDHYGNDQIGLNCRGALDDIQKQNIVFSEGLRVRLYGDALEAEAIITFRTLERVWVAELIKNTLRECK